MTNQPKPANARLMTALCEMTCSGCGCTIVPGEEFWLCVVPGEAKPDPLGRGGVYQGKAGARYCKECVGNYIHDSLAGEKAGRK